MLVPRDKEKAVQDYLDMIKKSWTWARLTEKEQQRFIESIEKTKNHTQTPLKGSYADRWKVMEALYATYLDALEYKPIGWRE